MYYNIKLFEDFGGITGGLERKEHDILEKDFACSIYTSKKSMYMHK